MKNIKATVEDEVYRRVRLLAAEMGTSVSALVSDYLKQVGAGESELTDSNASRRTHAHE